MAKRNFTEEQILTAMKQLEAGRTAAEMAREVWVSEKRPAKSVPGRDVLQIAF